MVGLVSGCGLVLDVDPADPKLTGPKDGGGAPADAASFDGGANLDGGRRRDAAGPDAETEDPDAGTADGDAGPPDAGPRDAGPAIPPAPDGFGAACAMDGECSTGLCRTTPDPPWCYDTACTAPCRTDEECRAWVIEVGGDPTSTICSEGVCYLQRAMLGARSCE